MTNGSGKSLESWIWGAACSIAETRRASDPDAATLQEWAPKPPLFCGGPRRQLMAAQLHVHALNLTELTSFSAMNAP
jgi:hypothetical protein